MKVTLSNSQMSVARRIMSGNASHNGIGSIAAFAQSANFKHDIGFDFGYPKTSELNFTYFYDMWKRHGLAHALTERTASKTWQTHPKLQESEASSSVEETTLESEVRNHFKDIRLWQKLQEADMRGMVGQYSAVIFRLGDGLPYDQPVKTVRGGVRGLVDVIPCWQEQLTPSGWDGDKDSLTYGEVTMYTFNESAVDPESGKVRSFSVHPDRALIWSRDETTFGDSKLESCFNALLDVEKIRGAGGEGFWKIAKAQPVLQASPDVDFAQLATMLGVEIDGLADALDEVVGKWSKGFDDSLVLQGMEAKTLGMNLPQPEQFFSIALQEIAASWPIPQKILVGMQTGERASTEDSREWGQICTGRRNSLCEPNIEAMVRRLESWGILPERDWFIKWDDLTAPSRGEKLAIAKAMSEINQQHFAHGQLVFTIGEIREAAGLEAIDDDDLSEFGFGDDDDLDTDDVDDEEDGDDDLDTDDGDNDLDSEEDGDDEG